MPVVVAELFDGLTLTRGQNSSATVLYLVYGTGDPVEAKNELLLQAPATFDGLTRTDVTVEPLTLSAWRGTAQFGTLPPEGEMVLSFDTTGGTERVTQSLETVGKYAPSGQAAPDFQGAIGVGKDSVDGVDVVVPVLNFSVTKTVQALDVTFAYVNFLRSMTGRVNGDIWKGFAKGEVLFNGAQAQGSLQDRLIPITFNFSASENAVGIPVGNITVPSKEGWHYLWARYAEDEDAVAKRIVRRPIAAYVERTYYYADFSTLGL